MSITVYTHADCLKHEMGPYHPECPARLESILATLKQASFADQLQWQEAPLATQEQLSRVHPKEYIAEIFKRAPQTGYVSLDPDTIMNPFTLPAALRAAGALVAAVEEIFLGKTQKAFCLVRPPGHHAEPSNAMGFCFFNNVAVGVAHALAQFCQRVAIVDFDVHHGNGTEAMFLNNPNVFFWSSFQHPFYPGAQLAHKPAHVHLCPLPAGSSSDVFRMQVEKTLIPALKAFKPECIFISAGFDAHALDPLANLQLKTEDYFFITQAVCAVTNENGGRVISTLEGGYHLTALAESVVAHLRGML